MAKGDAWWRRRAKQEELKRAEAAGEVADSLEVRMALLKRMEAGELTGEQVKAELASIKRGAHKAGKVSREEAYRRG